MRRIKIKKTTRVAECPICGHDGSRHSTRKRLIRDVGNTIELTYSMHDCQNCKRCFVNPEANEIAAPYRDYTLWFMKEAVKLWHEHDGGLKTACGVIEKKLGHRLAVSTLHDWIQDF